MKVEDGKGSGFFAEVDGKHRLKTFSTVLAESQQATRDGNSYTMFTGVINLTSADLSNLFYIKNTGDESFILDIINIKVGKSTNGVGDFQTVATFNPTAGTLISGGSTVVAVNNNFESANILDAVVLSGSEGSTITDGFGATDLLMDEGVQERPGGILPKNTSFSLGIHPPTGNTSVNISISIAVYLVGA